MHVIDYLTTNQEYLFKTSDENIQKQLGLELDFWNIPDQKYNELKKLFNSHNLDKLLNSEPKMPPNASKETLDTWKKLAPLNVDLILQNSKEHLSDIDLNQIEFKEIEG